MRFWQLSKEQWAAIKALCFALSVSLTLLVLGTKLALGNQTEVSADAGSYAVSPDSSWNQNFTLSYLGEFWGPKLRQLDGVDGPGSNVQLQNTIRAAYKLSDTWWLRVGQRFDFNFGERTLYSADPKRRINLFDPYIGVGKYKILEEGKHGVDVRAYLSYYFPVSRDTRDLTGTDLDRGNGRTAVEVVLNRYLVPSANIWASIDVIYWEWYTKNPTFDNITRQFELYNSIGIDITNSFSAYVGYNGFVDRYRDGIGTEWKDLHALELGAEFKLINQIYLNPFLESPFMLKDTTFTLVVRASLL